MEAWMRRLHNSEEITIIIWAISAKIGRKVITLNAWCIRNIMKLVDRYILYLQQSRYQAECFLSILFHIWNYADKLNIGMYLHMEEMCNCMLIKVSVGCCTYYTAERKLSECLEVRECLPTTRDYALFNPDNRFLMEFIQVNRCLLQLYTWAAHISRKYDKFYVFCRKTICLKCREKCTAISSAQRQNHVR